MTTTLQIIVFCLVVLQLVTWCRLHFLDQETDRLNGHINRLYGHIAHLNGYISQLAQGQGKLAKLYTPKPRDPDLDRQTYRV